MFVIGGYPTDIKAVMNTVFSFQKSLSTEMYFCPFCVNVYYWVKLICSKCFWQKWHCLWKSINVDVMCEFLCMWVLWGFQLIHTHCIVIAVISGRWLDFTMWTSSLVICQCFDLLINSPIDPPKKLSFFEDSFFSGVVRKIEAGVSFCHGRSFWVQMKKGCHLCVLSDAT